MISSLRVFNYLLRYSCDGPVFLGEGGMDVEAKGISLLSDIYVLVYRLGEGELF